MANSAEVVATTTAAVVATTAAAATAVIAASDARTAAVPTGTHWSSVDDGDAANIDLNTGYTVDHLNPGPDSGSDTDDAGPDTDDAGPDTDDAGPDTDDAGPDTDDAGSDTGSDSEPDDDAPGPHVVALLAGLLAAAHEADRRHKRRRTH